jgi:hypothetical protein
VVMPGVEPRSAAIGLGALLGVLIVGGLLLRGRSARARG